MQITHTTNPYSRTTTTYSPMDALVQAVSSQHANRYQPSSVQTRYGQLPENYTKTLANVFHSFEQLNKAASKLTEKNNNAMDKRTTDTNGSKAFSATAGLGATKASYAVSVKQLVTAQENTGGLFQTNGLGDFSSGTHTMKLALGSGKNADISVNVKSGESNGSVLSHMASAINSANLGVKAQAVTAKDSGGVLQTKLVLTSTSTGTKSSFSLTDKTGNLAALTGANTITTAAKDADYSVNGTNYTSQSNTVKLDNGHVSLTLKGVTSTPETLTVKADTSAIQDGVKEFVKSYNSTLNTLKQGGNVVSKSWYNDLTSQTARSSLSSIGIKVNADKTLSVDEAALSKALSTNFNLVQSTLTGPGGLASRVGAEAKSVSTSPLSKLVNNNSSSIFQPIPNDNYGFDLYRNTMNLQFSSMNAGNFVSLYA